MKPRLAMGVKRVATIAGLLLLVAAPAHAQTGYPPGPGTTQPPGTDATEDLGRVAPGQSVTRELCGFAPNSTVRITVNDAFVTNKTADGNGCVSVRFKVASADVVEVEGLVAAARCDSNELTATGSQVDGTAVHHTLRFDIACDVTNNGTAFSGANIARGGLAGMALVGTGALLVLGSRRRKAPKSAG